MEDDPIRTTQIPVEPLKALQTQYEAAGAHLEVRMELGSVWINEIIVHGAMKAHLIDNTDYSLSAEKPWCNYHTHRIQFEDGGWCWFRRGDDEEPTFEGHGVSVEIVNGRLIVKAREASRQFPDGDINPLEH